MRFAARHRFASPPDAVASVLSDPDFYLDLRLPDLAPAALVSATEENSETSIRLRFAYTGQLDPIAQRLLGGTALIWDQEVRVDRSAKRGRINFAATHDPRRLHGTAEFLLAPADGGTLRVIEGDLVVAVAIVGPLAERRIVPGIVARLALEALAADARLSGGSDQST